LFQVCSKIGRIFCKVSDLRFWRCGARGSAPFRPRIRGTSDCSEFANIWNSVRNFQNSFFWTVCVRAIRVWKGGPTGAAESLLSGFMIHVVKNQTSRFHFFRSPKAFVGSTQFEQEQSGGPRGTVRPHTLDAPTTRLVCALQGTWAWRGRSVVDVGRRCGRSVSVLFDPAATATWYPGARSRSRSRRCAAGAEPAHCHVGGRAVVEREQRPSECMDVSRHARLFSAVRRCVFCFDRWPSWILPSIRSAWLAPRRQTCRARAKQEAGGGQHGGHRRRRRHGSAVSPGGVFV